MGGGGARSTGLRERGGEGDGGSGRTINERRGGESAESERGGCGRRGSLQRGRSDPGPQPRIPFLGGGGERGGPHLHRRRPMPSQLGQGADEGGVQAILLEGGHPTRRRRQRFGGTRPPPLEALGATEPLLRGLATAYPNAMPRCLSRQMRPLRRHRCKRLVRRTAKGMQRGLSTRRIALSSRLFLFLFFLLLLQNHVDLFAVSA